MPLTDEILDATVRHSVYLERYKARVVQEIMRLVGDVETVVVTETMRVELDGMAKKDLSRLLTRIRKRIKDGYDPVVALIDAEVEGLAAYEGEWQRDLFRSVVPVELDWTSPAPEQLYAATHARPFQGRLLKEWYKGLPDATFRRVRETIRNGYVEGQTTEQIVRAIRGTRTTSGIMDQSRRGATAAVRTALAHTANVARNEVYRANRNLIKGVEWVSTLDGRTSAICRARDGKMWPVDKGPRPPAHPNCRSSTIPVVKSYRQLGLKGTDKGTRSSMNGQVSGELNYDQWLRRQPKAFQDEVLGVSKAKLFRDGLTVDKFVDRAGNELTLDQLRAREGER